MNKKEEIIKRLSKELGNKKSTRINFRVSDDLYEKLVDFKNEYDVNISDIIRISLMNYFVENEIDS
jgi:hypothetical protein